MNWKNKEFIYVTAIVLLILIAGWIYSNQLGDTLRYWDEEEYFIYVKNYLSTHIFTYDGVHPTAMRPPGYPFLLMSLGAIGANRLILRMVNFLALTGSVLLIYSWLKEQSDAKTGVIGVGMIVLYPVLFYAAGTFFPQTVGAFLFLLTLYIILKKPIRLWQVGIAGLVYGGLILTIPTFTFGIPLIGLWLGWRERAWRNALIFLTTTVLVIGIWTIRNYRVFDTFVFVTTDSGFNFLMGNAPETTPNSGLTIDFNKYVNEAVGLDEVQADVFYRSKAFQFIIGNKNQAFLLYISKLLNYFNFRNEMLTQGESSSLRDIVMLAGYGSLLLLVIARIICFRQFRFFDWEIFLLLFYLFSAFVYAIFFTRIRFRLPFDYLIIIVDALFLRNIVVRWFERWKSRRIIQP
jgi:4-amino-4-deoxy-L-arabinose transferase-like glycosyltransferase